MYRIDIKRRHITPRRSFWKRLDRWDRAKERGRRKGALVLWALLEGVMAHLRELLIRNDSSIDYCWGYIHDDDGLTFISTRLKDSWLLFFFFGTCI